MQPNDRRAFFRKGLSSLYVPFYDALCGKLGPEWQPYSGTRSFQDQETLYAKGRTIFPIGPQFIVTDAHGGESAHNWGCATDWTWFDPAGHLVWLKKEDPKWKEYIEAATAAGLRPGAEFGDVDHNELKLSVPWTHVLKYFNDGGKPEEFLKQVMVANAPPASM